jgi:hypothetical protein
VVKRDDASTFSLFGYSFDSVSHTTELDDTFPRRHYLARDTAGIDVSLPALTQCERRAMTMIFLPSRLISDTRMEARSILLYFDITMTRGHHQHWQRHLPPTPPLPYGHDEYRNYGFACLFKSRLCLAVLS